MKIETDVRLDERSLEMWREGDISFTELLKGLMKVEVADDQLRKEFAKDEERWLKVIGDVTRAVVKFNRLDLFEKESTKTFMLFGSNRVYERVCRELIALMNENNDPKLAKLVAAYCSQGKFSGQKLIESCIGMTNGDQVCVSVFQQLIQKMALQAIEEYEEVMDDDEREEIVACIRENRFADIDKLEFFYPMLSKERYDFFGEPDAKGNFKYIPNCVDAYVIQ